MLNKFVSTGFYVNDCGNGQAPITGMAIYTGFLNQCEADGQAYYLASLDAQNQRLSIPCLSDPTTTTTSTTSSATTLAPPILFNSGISYTWTDYFNGEANSYYDLVSWGQINLYLSGANNFAGNQYFTNISANDSNGLGVILAVLKNGKVTGIGDNSNGLLNIPTISGALQVSVGYDHCLVLLSNGRVTGWGTDQWGALNIMTGLSNVTKVSAGVGSSYFLLGSGFITGSRMIAGNSLAINIPTNSGFLDIDHANLHVLLTKSGLASGLGSNSFGESNVRFFTGISKISAGTNASLIVYNQNHTTGYGTNQAIFNTPDIHSGIDAQLKLHIGTILNKDQSITQWTTPYSDEANNILLPSFIRNNVVAISQGNHFTAAIIKRPCNFTYSGIMSGRFLWQVTGVDQFNGGISVGDLYPSAGLVIQPCDCDFFSLPAIINTGQSYSNSLTNCNNYAGIHTVYLQSVRSQEPMLNVNYTFNTGFHKVGLSATGITPTDYWNNIDDNLHTNSGLYYSDLTLSNISGGYTILSSGRAIGFTSFDAVYGSALSGISGLLYVQYSGLNTGLYDIFVYAHGQKSGDYSAVSLFKNGIFQGTFLTTSGADFNSGGWRNSGQYVKFSTVINNRNDVLLFSADKYLNGIQIINQNKTR